MRNITSRIYEGKQDFQSIIDLTSSLRPPQYRTSYPNQVDLEEAFASVVVPKNTRLWFDEELIA